MENDTFDTCLHLIDTIKTSNYERKIYIHNIFNAYIEEQKDAFDQITKYCVDKKQTILDKILPILMELNQMNNNIITFQLFKLIYEIARTNKNLPRLVIELLNCVKSSNTFIIKQSLITFSNIYRFILFYITGFCRNISNETRDLWTNSETLSQLLFSFLPGVSITSTVSPLFSSISSLLSPQDQIEIQLISARFCVTAYLCFSKSDAIELYEGRTYVTNTCNFFTSDSVPELHVLLTPSILCERKMLYYTSLLSSLSPSSSLPYIIHYINCLESLCSHRQEALKECINQLIHIILYQYRDAIQHALVDLNMSETLINDAVNIGKKIETYYRTKNIQLTYIPPQITLFPEIPVKMPSFRNVHIQPLETEYINVSKIPLQSLRSLPISLLSYLLVMNLNNVPPKTLEQPEMLYPSAIPMEQEPFDYIPEIPINIEHAKQENSSIPVNPVEDEIINVSINLEEQKSMNIYIYKELLEQYRTSNKDMNKPVIQSLVTLSLLFCDKPQDNITLNLLLDTISIDLTANEQLVALLLYKSYLIKDCPQLYEYILSTLIKKLLSLTVFDSSSFYLLLSQSPSLPSSLFSLLYYKHIIHYIIHPNMKDVYIEGIVEVLTDITLERYHYQKQLLTCILSYGNSSSSVIYGYIYKCLDLFITKESIYNDIYSYAIEKANSITISGNMNEDINDNNHDSTFFMGENNEISMEIENEKTEEDKEKDNHSSKEKTDNNYENKDNVNTIIIEEEEEDIDKEIEKEEEDEEVKEEDVYSHINILLYLVSKNYSLFKDLFSIYLNSSTNVQIILMSLIQNNLLPLLPTEYSREKLLIFLDIIEDLLIEQQTEDVTTKLNDLLYICLIPIANLPNSPDIDEDISLKLSTFTELSRDYRFKIPLIPWLSYNDTIDILNSIFNFSDEIVNNCYTTICKLTNQTTPQHLFVYLHTCTRKKQIVSLITLCIQNENNLYPDNVLLESLKEMSELSPLPELYMHTIISIYNQRISLHSDIHNIILTVTNKETNWNADDIIFMKGLAKYLELEEIKGGEIMINYDDHILSKLFDFSESLKENFTLYLVENPDLQENLSDASRKLLEL
ncbi:hypothetical protein WA158_006787 [Blastocystis sp. Blastoise]